MAEDSYKGDIKDPLSLNLYAYCEGNPLKYVDPSGHTKQLSENERKRAWAIQDACYNYLKNADYFRQGAVDGYTFNLVKILFGGYDDIDYDSEAYKMGNFYGSALSLAKIFQAIQNAGGSNKPSQNTTKIAGANQNHQNGAIAEAHGYENAIKGGEIGIQPPGKITANGPDFITFNPKTQTVNIWDAKYSSTGKWPNSAKGFGSKAWLNETKVAINNIQDPKVKQQALDAFNQNNINWQIFKWPK